MSTENRFNLIEEPWIPIVDVGLVSLRQIFTHSEYRALGGNPVQKIALTKLLLAIAQAAATPADDEAWAELGEDRLAHACLEYLEKWHDRFWLYGDKPFLQIPAICKAAIQSTGAVSADIATGNTTVLLSSQVQRPMSDAELALLLVQLMGFALGGKKTDNSVVLSPGYMGKRNDKGKPATGKPGPCVGFMGFLHNFVLGNSLRQTLWLNLFTHTAIQDLRIYPQGIGTAPWELMPSGEVCEVAVALQQSLMGRLLPMARFCLLADGGLHYSEGVAHPGYKEGVFDPSISINLQGKDPKAIWTDPDRRPWRYLTALLSFISQSRGAGFECFQLKNGLLRARHILPSLGIWSAGLRVSSNAGEQYASGSDDFVESETKLDCSWLGDLWFEQFSREMELLDGLAKALYGATSGYFSAQKVDGANYAGLACNLFWQLGEKQAQALVDASVDVVLAKSLRKQFVALALQAFDSYCPNDTARQLDAWAKNRPNFANYLNA